MRRIQVSCHWAHILARDGMSHVFFLGSRFFLLKSPATRAVGLIVGFSGNFNKWRKKPLSGTRCQDFDSHMTRFDRLDPSKHRLSMGKDGLRWALACLVRGCAEVWVRGSESVRERARQVCAGVVLLPACLLRLSRAAFCALISAFVCRAFTVGHRQPLILFLAERVGSGVFLLSGQTIGPAR